MIRRKLGWLPFVNLSIALLLLGLVQPVFAANSSSTSVVAGDGGNGLRISPVRADAVIDPGKEKTLNVSVTNITSSASTYQAFVNDFVSGDESGQPLLITDDTKYAPSHSLKRFVQPIPNFTLQAGEQKSIPVTVKVPVNAPGGGYYAAVRFAPAGSSNGGDPTKNLTLAGSAGSLILVRVSGDVKEQLNIASFDARTIDTKKQTDHASSFFLTNKNISVVIRFQNGGNVQEQPFGKVTLKDRSGKTLATYEVNSSEPKANVLPDSIRRFNIPLDKLGKFGKYKLEGNFGYGATGQLLTASTTFYVVPLAYLVIFFLIVLIILFMVFVFPRLLAAYKRRVIAQSRRRQ